MHYISTRNQDLTDTLSTAILNGLAKDGGLYLPSYLPQIELKEFSGNLSYPVFAEKVLRGFFTEDKLAKNLLSFCEKAFNFPVPVLELDANTFVLELFHGPTSSFKDLGARFLAECVNELSIQQKTTIMVATSGDTGSAVASAFYQKPNVDVIILFPQRQISARQQHQITCWGDNVLALAVNGTFDDCQRLVKAAFQDAWWQRHTRLSSANSINIGRLLPQIVYYAYSSVRFYEQHQTAPGFIIPTGNLGNAMAGFWAKKMGFPIREIVLSTNANKVIFDYLQTGNFQPRASIATLANAMDVGNPSNFERLTTLFADFSEFKKNVHVISASDQDIENTIKEIYHRYRYIICPHTATAFFARKQLSSQPWIVEATADPAKFEQVIEPLLDTTLVIPAALKEMLAKPVFEVEVENSLEAIKKVKLRHSV